MSALVNSKVSLKDSTSVTKISANARIDYILRFSKNAILVIDDFVDDENYVVGQFFAALPEQHNVAFVALSQQFNDIQVRCRIIEQLFSDDLFDPEVSLAVSVVNFAKHTKQAISIVVENTEYASLQIIHELCQLAEIAKQSKLSIDVVMFGSVAAGTTISNNKSIFQNNISLLSAQSGQLLSKSHAMFKEQLQWHRYLRLNKWALVLFIALIAISATVIWLLKQDHFTFSNLPTHPQTPSASFENIAPSTTVLPTTSLVKESTAETIELAKYSDVFNVLSGNVIVDSKNIEPPVPASPADIVNAMTSLTNNEQRHVDEKSIKLVQDKSIPIDAQQVSDVAVVENPNSIVINNSYFSQLDDGYVIQIAAFRDINNLPLPFVEALNSIEYQAYKRTLNNKNLTVITSAHFDSRTSASDAVLGLPKLLQQRKPWIKSIKAINREINTFEVSQ